MSKQRSRSPNYRFPWEELDFDPHRVEVLDKLPRDHRFRKVSEERRNTFRDEMYPGGHKIPPLFPDDPHFGRPRHPDQSLYCQSASPHRGEMPYPPQDERGFDDRRRREFREDVQNFENREAASSTPREAGMSLRRQERGRGRGRGRGQGRFEDFNPSERSGDQRVGDVERGRRSSQVPFKGRQRGNPHHERGPAFKRPRGEVDDVDRTGCGGEEDFTDRGYSADRPRGGFRGHARGNLPKRDLLIFEHDHGIVGDRNASQIDEVEDRKRYEPNFERQRSPRSMGSSQERFRTPDSRTDNRLERQFQDSLRDSNYRETRKSPNTMRYDAQDGHVSNRGRWKDNKGQGGSFEPPRNRSRSQDLPHDEQRIGYQPYSEHLVDKDPVWTTEDRRSQWEVGKSRSLERNLRRNELDPNMSGQSGWGDQKNENMTIITEETLTIKVDMSRQANPTSSFCYSSDRQLSFDLVNVGRQRLDFLPMLEHSGTYRETEMHTGAFAQEIISLVHYVKDQYFRGDGLTLNQRFSAPQKGFSEEELTLNQRFSSSSGFNLNSDSLLDDDDEELLFFRLESMQPSRGPGDLRHDLERRRQEKLEAVKVTIQGSGTPQRSHSEPDFIPPAEPERFWTGQQNRRREGNGPRGAPHRPNTGPARWNRYGNERQNTAGPNW